MSKRAEDLAKKLFPDPRMEDYDDVLVYRADRDNAIIGRVKAIKIYEQAEKDIKEVIVKHFKYKQDHSPEHTLHWWVYKNVIDKVNEL